MARLILIADDSPIIQRKAQRILEDEGFEVQTVSNGVAAVKKLPTLQPVLVLADVSMPGKDGYEVCEFVKTSAGLDHVPVLLVGSDLEPYDEQRGASVRADGIIKKPFTPRDLVALVTRLTGPAKTPPSLPPAIAETTAAASPETLPAASFDSPTIPPEPLLRAGGEEGIQLADVESLLHEGDEGLSMGGSHSHGHSHDVPAGLLEPSLAPTEPFPGFALESIPDSTTEPVFEVAPEPAFAGPEIGRGVEETGTQEIGELLLSPRLLDLTTSEAIPEPGPVIAEAIPEPTPEAAPNAATVPALAGPEGSREVEEPMSRGVEEPRPHAADELTSTSHLLDISTPRSFDSSIPPDLVWVYRVVQKVVTRMAPPVLAPEHVEELARRLTGEITAELGGVVENPDPAPESPPSN